MKKVLLVVLTLVAVILLVSCPQPVSPPKSSIATLSSLSVNGYSLDKAFAGDTTSYAAFVEKTTKTVTINAAVSDSKATISWNPDPFTTELVSGPNVFVATVTAEDGTTKKTYTVTIYRANASVEVLDSVNGSLVSPGGTIYVYSGGDLVYSIPFARNPQPVWLGPNTAYTVKASPTGRAQSSRENILGADDLKLTMICQRLDQNTFPAESPTIESIAYTTSTSTPDASTVWTPIDSGATVDFSTVTYIKVLGSGRSEMDNTSWAGFGILMGIDQMPSVFSGIAPDPELCSSTYDVTNDIFRGTAIFNVKGASIPGGEHLIYFVIYDRANNRTERILTVTNSKANNSGMDISSYYYQNLLADFRIYGTTREYFGKQAGTEGLTPLVTGPISYRVALSFKFQTNVSAGDPVPILGFKVFRSEDVGFTWTHIATVNYGAPSTGSGGTHGFFDTDSQLTTGISYVYKIVAFTDDTHTKESAVIGPVWFLPPFTASLSEPADKSTAIDKANLPDFKFTISDTRLWSQSLSDYFYFSPVIRKADGTYVYAGNFSFDFKAGTLWYKDTSTGNWTPMSITDTAKYMQFDTKTGTISINPDLFNAKTNLATGSDLALESGVTYYWDIFGDFTGSEATNTAAYFQKSGPNCISRSYADVYQSGNQTLNGWFSFTVR